jgi:cAMP-dependent protein kinase regulator
LARHATHGGHPLRALVALKVLTTLEPLLEGLLGSFAELYSRDSSRLGRAIRIAPGDPARPVPEGFALPTIPPETPIGPLIEQAAELGADLTHAGRLYPKQLPPIPLFSELPATDFARVLAALKLRRARPGQVLLAEGDPGQSFYVLARGAVTVEKGGQVLATLHDGAIFGEMALVSASPRTATVRAHSDCDLLEFDRDVLVAASQSVATLAAALDKFTRERLLHNLLTTAPLFQPLDRQQRLDLMRRFRAHDVAAGVPLIEEGTAGQGLYVLMAGTAEVWKRDGAHRVLLATLGPGEVFGEISLLEGEPATATVSAASQCTVLFLAREVFERLAQAVPEVAEYVRDLGESRRMDTRLLLDTLRGEDMEIELEELELEPDVAP